MAKLVEVKSGTAPAGKAAQQLSAEQLNAQQRAAVLHGEGPLLVVAGAGTGKTRVITERIRYLLETQPELGGEQILGLTFTEKAAGEMKWRVAQTAGERGQAVELGTFHAFCKKILEELDPEMAVLDPVDHWILLRRNLPLLRLERYRRLAEPGQFLADFVAFFSRCQDELVTPDDYQRYADELTARARRAGREIEADAKALMLEAAARQQEIARVYRVSEELLREKRLQTFGSMMMETVRLLDEDAEFAEGLRGRFRYILVDEFQDTNIAQLELLWRLARDHRNIVAVGDDDQAIYRFRGASFGSFQIFLEKYASEAVAARPVQRAVQTLTQNYRSTGRVLKTANQVIALNEKSELFPQKNLTPSKPPGEKVRIVEVGNAAHEARWVAAEIARLHAAGAAWRSFAVLYRAHAYRNLLVEEMSRAGIPFVIRNLSIFENPIVRDLIAYLRLIATPSDDVACARALAAPGWGFAPNDIVRLAERAQKNRKSLWDALGAASEEANSGLSGGARAKEFAEFITRMRKRARKISASELFAELAGELDLGVQAGGDLRAYHERLAQFIREWEMKTETRRLGEFVEYLDYFQQAGGQINLEEETGKDAVQLMTVHAAKGLEFDHVFILRMTRGAFPTRARTHLFEFPDELMKEQRPRGDFHIQEERRLFYVALTRAKERLTLTAVVDNKRNKPSPFLDDILENAGLARRDIEHLSPPAEAAGEAAPGKESGAGPASRQSQGAQELFPAATENARVFSAIAKWATEYRPPIAEPLHLSASAIETYRSCPQKYLFSNVWGIRSGPHAATSFGSVMHTTIKHFLAEMRKGRKAPFAEVEAIFEREWTPAGFEDDFQQAEYKREGIEQLRAFHASATSEPMEIEAQEKSFELPLEDDIVVIGRMDQINRIGAGQREIVDYKTGRPKTEEAARKDIQLSLYALAAREVLEFDPARLVFHNLADNSRVETSRGDKELAKTREIILETAASIRAGEFGPKPGFMQCRSCAFRPICPAHEQRVLRAPLES